MKEKESSHFRLNTRDINQNEAIRMESHGFRVELIHKEGEPKQVNRVMIIGERLRVELLPSKGFSIGEVDIDGEPVLWEPPIDLPDPDQLDLRSDEIQVFGEPTPGFTYIKTFAGGIEMLGMTNWGMPSEDPVTGAMLPLHGEVSNIPVEYIDFEINDSVLKAMSTIIYRKFKGDSSRLWYERGEEMYRITKTLVIDKNKPGFVLIDSIRNTSEGSLVPDWGYHVTFRPRDGSRLLVPSHQVEERSGGALPKLIDTWEPAADEGIRTEIGIIHKELKTFGSEDPPLTSIMKLYPDGRALRLDVPQSPYFQTWYSSGGAGYEEFTFKKDNTPVFSKSWNGFGIELGSSPLDHNGNIDPSVHYKDTLGPGETMAIRLSLELLDPGSASKLKEDIENYNTGRKP